MSTSLVRCMFNNNSLQSHVPKVWLLFYYQTSPLDAPPLDLVSFSNASIYFQYLQKPDKTCRSYEFGKYGGGAAVLCK